MSSSTPRSTSVRIQSFHGRCAGSRSKVSRNASRSIASAICRSEKEEKSTDAAQSANPVSAELRRAHERESTHQGKRGDENQSNDGAAYSENLEDGNIAHEPFANGVHGSERGNAEHHVGDAGKPVDTFIFFHACCEPPILHEIASPSASEERTGAPDALEQRTRRTCFDTR